jgi:FMN phosphatase YigB (HAD superfamily)
VRLRAALFDVGNTLLGWPAGDDPWRSVVLTAIEREFGTRPWAEALYAADIRRPPPGDPYRQETNRWLADWLTANAETLDDADVERLRRAFASPLRDGWRLLPGAVAALRWCKDQGLAVVLVSNMLSTGDEELRRNWDQLAPPELVDHIVSSHSTGWMKPHPAMYRRALALVGAEPTEAFMVGDSYELDVVGAKLLGIRAVWKTSDPTIPDGAVFLPDGVITSLEDLAHVVGPWLATEPDPEESG